MKKALALHYLTCGMLTLVRSGGAKSMWQNMMHVGRSLCCFGYLPMDGGNAFRRSWVILMASAVMPHPEQGSMYWQTPSPHRSDKQPIMHG